jgi:hypothetical protein
MNGYNVMNSELWKGNPFHFRLYFDTFSTNAKGSLTYVLMIDVDRPSIEMGMAFFQNYFDGDKFNSPNKLAYLFLPLYRKNYSDDERLTIIKDNDHHTENVSVVALSGLNNLNTVVNLNQGTKTTIRHLLLAIPAQTSTNKLFMQIERQPSNQWLLCCFYTTDATNVTLRLGSLENLLKRYVKTDDYSLLFTSPDYSLQFNGQAAPVKKGRNQKVIQETPETTTTYARTAMQKLRPLNPKRLAVEYSESPGTPQPVTLPQTVTPAPPPQINIPLPSGTEDDSTNPITENNITNQNHRLTRLEECCVMLAESSSNLQRQLVDMNNSLNARMNEMADAIGKLHTYSPGREAKLHKNHDNPTMDLDFGYQPRS